MNSITGSSMDNYLMKLAFENDPLILKMEAVTKERSFPIVDRLVGRLLYILGRLKKPKLILELGSGYGYSAYWFARAVGKGKIVLTDYDEGNIAFAKKSSGKHI